MPLKNSKIPILSPNIFAQEFSPESLGWKDYFYDTYMVFSYQQIRRLFKTKEFYLYAYSPTQKKQFMTFFFVTNGEIFRDKGLDAYQISKNTFFFVPASQITTIKSMSSDTQGFYCHFNLDIFSNNFYPKEFIEQFPFLHHTGNPMVKIENDDKEFVMQILQRLEKEYKSKNCNLDLAASCIATLLHETSRFIETKPKIKENSASRIAERYKLALGKDIQEKQKISYYADLISVTPEYLNRCVKATYGKTSHELLDEMILLEAKVLLKQSSLNISELAFKIGKQNPSDFIRFFQD